MFPFLVMMICVGAKQPEKSVVFWPVAELAEIPAASLRETSEPVE
jgi:hypothetical protein